MNAAWAIVGAIALVAVYRIGHRDGRNQEAGRRRQSLWQSYKGSSK